MALKKLNKTNGSDFVANKNTRVETPVNTRVV